MASVREVRQSVIEGPDSAPHDALRSAAHTIVSRSHYTAQHGIVADCTFQSHFHTDFTVTTLLAGEIAASVGEERFVALAGQTILTSQGELHSATAEKAEFVSIRIEPRFIDELLAEIGLIPNAVEIAFRNKLVLDDVIRVVASAVRFEVAGSRAGRGRMLDALVHQLIIHLGRNHFSVRRSQQVELSRAGPVDRRLRRALEFMHDNYAREVALEEIAAAAYLSEYHFARLFKQITGVSPGIYLSNLRIERARQLLAETRKSISEVALLVGYQSQSHFTKVFKAVTGVTPRGFRESSPDFDC